MVVANNARQLIAQPRDVHARRDGANQADRVDVAANVFEQVGDERGVCETALQKLIPQVVLFVALNELGCLHSGQSKSECQEHIKLCSAGGAKQNTTITETL